MGLLSAASRSFWWLARPSQDDQLYRAMDFLLANGERVQQSVFHSVANLLNLEVDVIFFDTTSTYFESDWKRPWRESAICVSAIPERSSASGAPPPAAPLRPPRPPREVVP